MADSRTRVWQAVGHAELRPSRRASSGPSTSWTSSRATRSSRSAAAPAPAPRRSAAKLETGKLFAIDRSESGVDRTKRRNQKYVDAGRLVVRQIDLATLRVPVKRLNKVFAFNVNLFWVRACDDEIALLHERVVPGGAVYLFYEASRPELVPNIVKKASENLLRGGFRVSVVEQKAPPVIGLIAKR